SEYISLKFDIDKIFCIIFFFQAEDGIRDFHVTGVQTCALPIWSSITTRCWRPPAICPTCWPTPWWTRWPSATRTWRFSAMPPARSEERRVGKEYRYMRAQNL